MFEKKCIEKDDVHIIKNGIEIEKFKFNNKIRDEYREKFDLSVSRAVANLSTLSEYCLPYIRVGGIFVSYKSSTVDEEIEQAKNAVKILGGKIENNIKFQIPESEIGRSFIKIQKNKITPKKYPRKAGLPSKEPL